MLGARTLSGAILACAGLVMLCSALRANGGNSDLVPSITPWRKDGLSPIAALACVMASGGLYASKNDPGTGSLITRPSFLLSSARRAKATSHQSVLSNSSTKVIMFGWNFAARLGIRNVAMGR